MLLGPFNRVAGWVCIGSRARASGQGGKRWTRTIEAREILNPKPCTLGACIWVVVKIMVPLWIPIIIRHLIFRVPKKGPYF